LDGELIIVALISTLGGLGGLWIINQNWFKRQEVKYRYQMRRAKLSQKYKTPVKEEKSTLGVIGDLAPLLRNLDSDQIGALADRFLGGDIDTGAEGNALDGLLSFAQDNPEIVNGFLKGLNSGKGENPASKAPSEY